YQEPVLWLAVHFGEDEFPSYLFPQERERNFACVVLLLRSGESLVFSVVPDADLTRSVRAFRKRPLKFEIVQAVIGNRHSEPLIIRIHRRPFRHRPGFPDAVYLQPKVEMQPPRVMFVNDEPFANRGLFRELDW